MRQRAHSSAADLVMKSFNKPVFREVVGRPGTFDETVRSLVEDKYNREYKLDKKTKAKALDILTDYYAKHQDEATNVSILSHSFCDWNQVCLNQYSVRITDQLHCFIFVCYGIFLLLVANFLFLRDTLLELIF